MLDHMDSYEAWLKSVTDNVNPETVNPEWVVTDTYFAVDEQDKIVGIIDLRHELKGFLVDFGNTGYSVRPSHYNYLWKDRIPHRSKRSLIMVAYMKEALSLKGIRLMFIV